MKKKNSNSFSIFNLFNICILSILALLCIYPIWYVLMASLSNGNLIMQHSGLLLLPIKPNIAAYIAVFKNKMILSGYLNTIKILIISLILQITMTSIGAYFFSRERVLFKKPLMFIITLTMFISGGMIPFYQNLRSLHLIILKTSFESIPKSLSEAARIDGAGHIRILFSIVLPLSKPVLAVMLLYYGVGVWNGWFWASTILTDRAMYPLQVILREILLSNDTSVMTQGVSSGDLEAVGATIRYATVIVATLPILCAYPFLQKYFTKGIMIGAVKE